MCVLYAGTVTFLYIRHACIHDFSLSVNYVEKVTESSFLFDFRNSPRISLRDSYGHMMTSMIVIIFQNSLSNRCVHRPFK